MKKQGLSVIQLFFVSAAFFAVCVFVALPVLAGDIITKTLVRDELKLDVGGTLDTGSGTFKIGGTAVTATAAQLNAAGSNSDTMVTNVSAQTATVSGTVTPQPGAAVTATGTVSIVGTWVTFTNIMDNVTNVYYACTEAPTATTAINVLNGTGLLTNSTVSVPGVATNVLNQR